MIKKEIYLKNEEKNPIGIYRVRRGDTVEKICYSMNLPLFAVVAENGLTKQPSEGSLLFFPMTDRRVYTVQAGDTRDSICRKFGISAEELFSLNHAPYVFPNLKIWV